MVGHRHRVDVARVVIEDAENGEIEGESPEGVAETTEAPKSVSETDTGISGSTKEKASTPAAPTATKR